MPVIKSAIKRVRQDKKRKAYNIGVKTSVKAKFKAVRDEVATGKVKSNEELVAAIKAIDQAVRKGVINKHSAGRKKSRLTLAYNSVAEKAFGTEPASKPKAKKTAAAKKPAAKKATTIKKTAAKKPATKKAAPKK